MIPASLATAPPVSAAPPTRWRIVYEHCGVTWEDVWDCACNDRCPVCNREIEPVSWADADRPPDVG